MDPHVAVHGSFSVMVNYHAIGLYCTSRAGFVLHDPQEEASLKVSVLVFTGEENISMGTNISNIQTLHNMSRGFIHTWTGNEVERLSAATARVICDISALLIHFLGSVTCIPKSVSRVL